MKGCFHKNVEKGNRLPDKRTINSKPAGKHDHESVLYLAPEGLSRIARTFMSGRDCMESPPI
jgi:hypothetical protein